MEKQKEQPSAYEQWEYLQQHETQQKVKKKGLSKTLLSHNNKNISATKNKKANLQTSNWVFSKNGNSPITNEMQIWIQSYLGLNLAGLIVLDVGAGEGKTSKFFLEHGAAKVVCIEPCKKAYSYLARNALMHPEVSATNKRFSLSDLDLPYDFLKLDIEGFEEKLLDADLFVPAVVEVHGLQLQEKFKRAGWRIRNANNSNDNSYTSYAYWMC